MFPLLSSTLLQFSSAYSSHYTAIPSAEKDRILCSYCRILSKAALWLIKKEMHTYCSVCISSFNLYNIMSRSVFTSLPDFIPGHFTFGYKFSNPFAMMLLCLTTLDYHSTTAKAVCLSIYKFAITATTITNRTESGSMPRPRQSHRFHTGGLPNLALACC